MQVEDLLFVLIPSALVILGLYFIVKTLLSKQSEQQEFLIQKEFSSTTLPLRLQAYERMTLFLERISPNNLLLRVYEKAQFVSDFQQMLLKDIREEYYHNLAQQVYISQQLWEEISKAMNEMMALINTAAGELKPDDKALALSQKIFEKVINGEEDPTRGTLRKLKKEAQQLF